MAEHTSIEWTEATWNPITGCSVVSPGCTNCYAMRLAGTRLKHHFSRAGLTRDTKAGPVWTGEVRLNQAWIEQPLTWKRPRNIFVCAHGDLFHEDVPDHWIDRVFTVMEKAPWHFFQVLTKRADRMRAFALNRSPMAHVWLGFSAEDQARFDKRSRAAREIAQAGWMTWCSAEPLLSDIDLGDASWLSWLVAGGESGPGARPMHPAWPRSLRDQCLDLSVPFFFKQHGEWIGAGDLRAIVGGAGPGFGQYDHHEYDMATETLRVGKKRAGRLLDGRQHNAFPEVMP